MPTVRKTITVTDQQDQWIAAQVQAGRFTNDSELNRDLTRRCAPARAGSGRGSARWRW